MRKKTRQYLELTSFEQIACEKAVSNERWLLEMDGKINTKEITERTKLQYYLPDMAW